MSYQKQNKISSQKALLEPSEPKAILLQKALQWLQQEHEAIPTFLLQDAFRELDSESIGEVEIDVFCDVLQRCDGWHNVLAEYGVQVRDIILESDKNFSGGLDMDGFIFFFRHLEDFYNYYNEPGVSYVFATLDWGWGGKLQMGNKVRLDEVVAECAEWQDRYDISIIDNDTDGAALPSPSDMKANGNYTITKTEGGVSITVIWNGSKKDGQMMPVFEAIRYCKKKEQYLKSVPEGKISFADNVSGAVLSDLSDMKKGGNYTLSIANPWAARRFWHKEVAGAEGSVDPAIDAEKHEYVARRAAQNWQGWVAGADARRNFQRRKECAIFIQRVWRGHRCRKRLGEIKAISSEWQKASWEAKSFRLAEKVFDLQQENKYLRSQIEDYQDYYNDDDELSTPCNRPFNFLPLEAGYTNGGSYTPPGGLPMNDLGPLMLEDPLLAPPFLSNSIPLEGLPMDDLGPLMLEHPGRGLCGKEPPSALNWRGLRSAKHNLNDMENRLLECQLDFDFYADSDPSDAAKQIFNRTRDRVSQLESEVAAAKTKLEAESNKWLNKGGTRSASNRLIELEDRLHSLQNLLSPDVVFKQFDADCSGTLNLMELRVLFQQLDPGRWTDDMVDRLFTAVDQNGNNEVEFHEFMSWALGNK